MSKVLFIDIESVPIQKEIPPSDLGDLFIKKYRKEITESQSSDSEIACWKQKAALHAEFGKIVCVSIGAISGTKLHVKAIASRNEKEILIKLSEAIEKSQCNLIAGHNSTEFDFPFLMRRYIINQLPVPPILNPDGRKPWESPYIDTMKLWSASAWNYKVSLDLLANCLSIASPKGEMDGSKVAEVFYGSYKVESGELPFDAEDEALKAIGKYCNGDVVTTYKVYCRLKGIEAVSFENIVFA